MQQAPLNQIGLVDVLDGVHFLADGSRQGGHPDRSAGEFLDNGLDQLLVVLVKSGVVDSQHGQAPASHLPVDGPVGLHLGVVADPAEQAVAHPGRATRPGGDFPGSRRIDPDAQDFGRASHDHPQLLLGVVVEPVHDAEAGPQRRGDQPCPGGGAHQRKGGEIERHASGAGPLADDQVQLEVLQGRIEDLLDLRQQAVNLVDEQHVVGLQVGENGRQVSLDLNDGPGGGLQPHSQLVGDDSGQGGLSQAGRTVEQHVVQGLAAGAGRRHRDLQVLLDLGLAYILLQNLGAQAELVALLLLEGSPRNDSILVHREIRNGGKGNPNGSTMIGSHSTGGAAASE